MQGIEEARRAPIADSLAVSGACLAVDDGNSRSAVSATNSYDGRSGAGGEAVGALQRRLASGWSADDGGALVFDVPKILLVVQHDPQLSARSERGG